MSKTLTRIIVCLAVSFITYMMILVLIMMTALAITTLNGA